MQDDNIVFGGEKKLAAAIQEAYDIFKPKAIGVFSTCPVGLIGDDVHAVARQMKEKLGDCNVFGSQLRGLQGRLASRPATTSPTTSCSSTCGRLTTHPEAKYKINILGEYNIGGDAFEIDRIFASCGINVIGTFGQLHLRRIRNCHTADLNVVMCHRSINYMAEMMEEKFGIPWFKVNFIGLEGTKKSLRKIAQYFGDKELVDKVEEVIAAEMAEVRGR
jgi:nitrogenase molybdenum-iron protein alpha chain